MKYSPERARTISGLRRVSKPGLRVYTQGRQGPPRPRRPRRRRPLHQPGAHDRPRGAQAQRRRRDPLLRLVRLTMSRIGKSPHPRAQRRRRHDRRAPHHREGPEGHARARPPRRHHRPPGRRASCWSSAPTTSARTAPCTASPARSSNNMVVGRHRGLPQGARDRRRRLPRHRPGHQQARARPRLQPPGLGRRPRRHHVRGAARRPASSCGASTRRRSARWPPTSARSASPSPTRARASATLGEHVQRKAGKTGK